MVITPRLLGADTELRPSMVSVVYLLSVRPSVEELARSSTEEGCYASNHLTFSHHSLEF